MDVMLQEHDAKLVLPVPEGLRELACDISREVLRAQPTNICQFIADYTAALLDTRDKAREAAIIVHDILEHGLTYEAMLERRGISMEVANRAATIIQACVRGYLERKRERDLLPKEEIFDLSKYMDSLGLPYEEIEAKVTKIQALYRGYDVRKNIKKHRPQVSKSLMDFLIETGVTLDEANRAAICIQRGYRKYNADKLDHQRASITSGELEEKPTTPPLEPEFTQEPERSGDQREENVSLVKFEASAEAEERQTPDEGAAPESVVTSEAPDTGAPPNETTETTTDRDQVMSEVTTDDEATTSPETSVASPEPATDEGGSSPGRTDASATGGDDTEASEIEEEEEEE